MNKIKKYFILIIVFALSVGVFNFNLEKKVFASEQITLTESVEEIVNPDCGFYKAFSGKLYRNMSDPVIDEESIQKDIS